ncbi:hypothetical protein D3C87_144570 [compost metagenome]
MNSMKKISLIATFTFLNCTAYAQDMQSTMTLQQRLGAEIGALYLSQSSGGNTTTVLPMLNAKLWNKDSFAINTQIGGTAYKDQSTDKTFTIAVARINPIYQIAESKWSVEGLLGLQAWEGKGGAKADFGARVNYDIKDLSQSYLDDASLGAGTVAHEEAVTYVTLGVKKWF